MEWSVEAGTVLGRHLPLEHTRIDGVEVTICSLCSDAEREDGSRSYLLWPCDAYQIAARLAEAREQFKSVFILRDGEPYYYTRNAIAMEIPERIIKNIKAAIRRGKVKYGHDALLDTARTVTNNDKILWRKIPGDPNSLPSLHVTEQGAIGINVGGTVHVMPAEQWHALAARLAEAENWPQCEICNCPLQDQGTPNGLVCILCNKHELVAKLQYDLAAATTWAKQAEATLNDPSYQECCANLKKAEQQRDRLAVDYNELIMMVGNKYPNETRHQTALKYIKQAETVVDSCAEAALREIREGRHEN